MLLEWVLTRDIEAVLSMVDDYGGWRVGDGGAARIRPSTLDDVSRAHWTDEALHGEEKAREAVRRANVFILPARRAILDALCIGILHGWARPNGRGCMTRIEPIQWAGLQFRSVDGHDVALPVDSEGDPLSLPRPLEDYLTGAVPLNSSPTVWPDPVFSPVRAMSNWRKDAITLDGSIGNPDALPSDISDGPNVGEEFADKQNGPPESAPSKSKPKSPRLKKGHWVLARGVASEWLDEEGGPIELGDQAKLEKHITEFLASKDVYPAESTVRKYVVQWIGEYREPGLST